MSKRSLIRKIAVVLERRRLDPEGRDIAISPSSEVTSVNAGKVITGGHHETGQRNAIMPRDCIVPVCSCRQPVDRVEDDEEATKRLGIPPRADVADPEEAR
jgi:hypothetical protein